MVIGGIQAPISYASTPLMVADARRFTATAVSIMHSLQSKDLFGSLVHIACDKIHFGDAFTMPRYVRLDGKTQAAATAVGLDTERLLYATEAFVQIGLQNGRIVIDEGTRLHGNEVLFQLHISTQSELANLMEGIVSNAEMLIARWEGEDDEDEDAIGDMPPGLFGAASPEVAGLSKMFGAMVGLMGMPMGGEEEEEEDDGEGEESKDDAPATAPAPAPAPATTVAPCAAPAPLSYAQAASSGSQ